VPYSVDIGAKGSATASRPQALNRAEPLPAVRGHQTTTTRPAVKFKTVKAVHLELQSRGGYLETIRDTEMPEYAPHLSSAEQGWPHGSWIKDELLLWASENLT
jgi:hypothetical protein